MKKINLVILAILIALLSVFSVPVYAATMVKTYHSDNTNSTEVFSMFVVYNTGTFDYYLSKCVANGKGIPTEKKYFHVNSKNPALVNDILAVKGVTWVGFENYKIRVGKEEVFAIDEVYDGVCVVLLKYFVRDGQKYITKFMNVDELRGLKLN